MWPLLHASDGTLISHLISLTCFLTSKVGIDLVVDLPVSWGVWDDQKN